MSRAGWARGGKQAVILSEALVPSLNLAFEVHISYCKNAVVKFSSRRRLVTAATANKQPCLAREGKGGEGGTSS